MSFDKKMFLNEQKMAIRVYNLLTVEISETQADALIELIKNNPDATLAEQDTLITNYLT